MNIQTAGEQRYYDFLEERMKKQRNMDIIWMSILCAALITLVSGADMAIPIGIGIAAIGVILAVKNIRSKKSLERKLDIVGDKKNFFNQLVDAETVELKDLRLLITKEYLLRYKDDLYIYKFSDMKSVEIKGNKLYLIDKEKNRYEVAVNEKGKEESFDTACQLLIVLVS